MLIELLQATQKVHRATTAAEREAIYRFRYTIYVEELGRNIGGVDHRKKEVRDEEDEARYTIHLYIGKPDRIAGAVRLRAWRPGTVPKKDFQMLSLDLFPNASALSICEIGRFMIRPTMRGKLLLPALAAAGSSLLGGELKMDLVFCYCRPGLVDYYRRLGARSYGGRPIETEEGMEIPLASVLSDIAHFKAVGAPQARLLAKQFGPGKRPPVDSAPFAHLFESQERAVVTDAKKVFLELQRELLFDPAKTRGFLERLGAKTTRRLASHGFILSTPDRAQITREGHKERELFIILQGTYEAFLGDRLLAQMNKGELFGEIAFFNDRGRRSASVRAKGPGRLLVVRRKFLEKLLKDDPDGAFKVLFEVGRILAERVERLSRGA